MSSLRFLKDFSEKDLEALGLKCGLEIHQQLNTGKLFSNRPCKIVPNEELIESISRKLRFSVSESGDIDKAALSEFKKNKTYVYMYNSEIASLVDLDEQPPGRPNQSAFETGLKVGLFLQLDFFDKIQFMRKLIVDGSIVSGFQRTAMLGTNGKVSTSFGEVSISGINVEEDSSRAIERGDDYAIFSLDRQGIPLIEITTGPDVKTPQQAQELALQLGNILRSFKETRRGLGTIRQDLNVSIIGGSRVEIKGAQNLKLLPEIISNEMRRQSIHLSIIEELKQRGISAETFIKEPIVDVTSVFEQTESSVLLKNLEVKGSKVLGIPVREFKGILGHELQENFRFATEISDKNKHMFPKIKGLFHSDELPKYGISIDEVEHVRSELNLNDNDAFILVCYEEKYARKSLEYIQEIIVELLQGVPEEVRQVDPKGVVTKFLRPMPGAARMYPETDVPEIELTTDYLERLRRNLPELYDKKINRLEKEFNLEKREIEDFLSEYSETEVASLLSKSSLSAKALYSIVFDLPKDIKKRENIEPVSFSYSLLEDLLSLQSKESLNQKAIRDIFISLYKDNLSEVESLEKYVKEKNLIAKQVSDEELKNIIEEIISKHPGAPFGALMGMVMKAVPGVDGKKASQIIKNSL
jgi:glutamyl-tRNA(Gln) amidotransferase subunit E